MLLYFVLVHLVLSLTTYSHNKQHSIESVCSMLKFQIAICLVVLSKILCDTATSVKDLKFDENERLAAHLMLFHGTSACKHEIDSVEMAQRLPVEMDQGFASKYFENTSSECSAVCLERGTHIDHIFHPLPDQVHTELADMAQFIRSCQKAEIGFISYAEHIATINWVNGDTRVPLGELKQGERNTIWRRTFLGHIFEITDNVTGDVSKRVTVEHTAIITVGSLQQSKLQKRDVIQQIKNTFRMEWDRAHKVQRTFTELGFTHGTLPKDLWTSMSTYYYNNGDNKVLEEFNNNGVIVNWWESDVFYIPMPLELRKYWQSRLKTLVEAWSGVELELTDIYGMRRYNDGARLLTHVDREATHAASLIINIAQEAIREPWKVEIYDFANRLHEVTMNPGDIVYYESARCLHGRMQPLQGAYYVNLFAHYRPVGDPTWFTKPNPANAPKPLLDIGTCTSNGTAVECAGTDKPTPLFLSPYLDTLHSHEDLYSFWERVAPKKQQHEEL